MLKAIHDLRSELVLFKVTSGMGNVPDTLTQSGSQNANPQTCSDHQGGINCLAISADGHTVATGSDDCTARIWNDNGPGGGFVARHVLQGHDKYIRCICIENGHVLTGSADGTLRKWNTDNGQCVHVYKGHTDAVNRMITTKNFIFTSSHDCTARCWQFDTSIKAQSADNEFCLKVFNGHASAVFPLIYIPMSFGGGHDNTENGTGCTLVTGSADCTARAWSVSDGRCLRRFVGHTGSIQCMSVDQYGKILFTGAADKTIRSWDLERRGESLKVFEGHEKAVLSMLVSFVDLDGKALIRRDPNVFF